jgi:murein DD-endopeptidase MepM/ murein hydrolase activator NlpD
MESEQDEEDSIVAPEKEGTHPKKEEEKNLKEKSPETEQKTQTQRVKFGETLYGFFIRHIRDISDVQRIIHLLKKNKLLKKFKAGTEFTFTTLKPPKGPSKLERLVFYAGKEKVILIRDAETKDLVLKKSLLSPVKKYFHGIIKHSLYYDAKKVGIPDLITNQFARLISHNVDFQRSIREGDTFEIFCEVYHDEETNKIFPGKLFYGALHLKSGKKDLYRYHDAVGHVFYYSSKAEGTVKPLLKTPVPGAPISGRFGLRKHPILGYSRMHKGIDFGAPRGTPVLAAGEGVIQKAFRFGSYGNYVLIKHNKTLKTAYAHLHKFAKGIKPGVKVKQGQIIAYVGSTGRSTGPHLHYEIHVNNKKVNPQTLKLPSMQKLSSQDIKRFKAQKAHINSLIKKAKQDADLEKISPP